jgi:hypothetical protein
MTHQIAADLTALATPIGQLDPLPGNPRRGDVDAVAASYATFGQRKPVVARRGDDGRGTVIAGNHQLAAAKKLGWSHLAVVWVDDDDTTAAAFALADNRTAELGGYDDDALVAMIQAVAAEDEALLSATGWSDGDIALIGDNTVTGDSTDTAGDAAGPVEAPAVTPTLADRFVIPPFTILDARSGVWQDRKRGWLALGIKSEEGRDAPTYQQSSLNAIMRQRSTGQDAAVAATGTSVFDPVLCELAYRWFSPVDGTVLDPFAGGSVRGIVAAATGRRYTGIDLRAEQVAANQAQWATIGKDRSGWPAPTWVAGDSNVALDTVDVQADLVFSCPPYADLEVYSDDPADLSNMNYDEFLTIYRSIIAKAVARLRDDRFVVWVVGDVRDKRGIYRGLVPNTIAAFEDAGARYYNEAILVTPVGTLPIRAGQSFAATRKLGKTHQNVLVFVKGDPKRATAACGVVEVADVADAFGEVLGDAA